MRVMKCLICWLVVGFGNLLSSDAFATLTETIGTRQSGNSEFDLRCPSNDGVILITSIEVTYGENGLQRVRLTCRKTDANGNWQEVSNGDPNILTMTNWGGATSSPGTAAMIACSDDKFVTSFNAYVVGPPQFSRLVRLRVVCSEVTFFGQSRPGTTESHEVGVGARPQLGNLGNWSDKTRRCPMASSANGIKGTFSSQAITVLGLRCIEPNRLTFAGLARTFRHSRCVNCHNHLQREDGVPLSVEEGGIVRYKHSSPLNASCNACHQIPGWRMPALDKNMSFLGHVSRLLCRKALDFNSTTEPRKVFEHLREDPLVLWAVGDGTVGDQTVGGDNFVRLPKAEPFDTEAWRKAVTAWENDLFHPTNPNPDTCSGDIGHL
jgi:hypothetical protein